MIKKGKEKIRKSDLIKAEKYQTEPDEVVVANETVSEEIDSEETNETIRIRLGSATINSGNVDIRVGSACKLSYDDIREMFVRGTSISNRLDYGC